jgi:hypothetical protein
MRARVAAFDEAPDRVPDGDLLGAREVIKAIDEKTLRDRYAGKARAVLATRRREISIGFV